MVLHARCCDPRDIMSRDVTPCHDDDDTTQTQHKGSHLQTLSEPGGEDAAAGMGTHTDQEARQTAIDDLLLSRYGIGVLNLVL